MLNGQYLRLITGILLIAAVLAACSSPAKQAGGTGALGEGDTANNDTVELTFMGWEASPLETQAVKNENTYKKYKLKFIPYYSWANRGIGEMLVWVRML